MYIFVLGVCLVLLILYLSLRFIEKKPSKYKRRLIDHIPENKLAVVGDTAKEVIRRERVFRIIKHIISYTFLVFMAFCMIIPFYWMIATSLKTAAEIDLPTPTFFPGFGKYELALSNYPQAIERLNAGRLIFNTIVVGVFSTIGTVVTTVMAAFAFSRIKFKGRELIFTVFLATMMIPGEMMVITNYITVTKTAKTLFGTSGIDTYWAMIVPFLISVYYIYLLRQNFKQIPNELYYAAKVDGTSDFKYLIKIMVPIAMPTIITITILKLMGSWNAYVWPMMVTRDANMRLITTGLRSSFSDSEGRTAQGLQMAATTVVTLPLLLVFIFLRKYIMRGVSRSGIKG